MLERKQCRVRVCQPAVSFAASVSGWLPWRRQLPAVLPPAEQMPLQLLSFPARPALLPSSYLYLPAHPSKHFECWRLLFYLTEHFSCTTRFDFHLSCSQVLTVLSGYCQAKSMLQNKACLSLLLDLLQASLCTVLNASMQSKPKQHLRSKAQVSIHSKFRTCMNQSPSQDH